MRFACWIMRATHTHTHTHTQHTHTKNTHTHTHTYLQYVKLSAFALHQFLGEHTSILRYTIIACLHVMLHISNCLLCMYRKITYKITFRWLPQQIIQIPFLSITLKCILEEYDERLWAVFNCVTTWLSGKIFWKQSVRIHLDTLTWFTNTLRQSNLIH